jgi:hypothetical protein
MQPGKDSHKKYIGDLSLVTLRVKSQFSISGSSLELRFDSVE